MVATAVGGTVSRITGGKFANGAITAALVHLYNAEGGPPETNSSLGPGAYELENGNGLVQLSVNDMGGFE